MERTGGLSGLVSFSQVPRRTPAAGGVCVCFAVQPARRSTLSTWLAIAGMNTKGKDQNAEDSKGSIVPDSWVHELVAAEKGCLLLANPDVFKGTQVISRLYKAGMLRKQALERVPKHACTALPVVCLFQTRTNKRVRV